MIDLTINKEELKRTVHRARERKIIIPTFRQQRNPELIPQKIREKLREVELWEVHPYNLFRITWKNEPIDRNGGFGEVNTMEIPSEISGVDARIIALIGKWFPTGSHKVGATFGCLVPRLVTGQFDPTHQKAVWPSTGNFCRGGSYNAALLACESIAILPEEMSRERFDWLSKMAGEVITTPGGESNVKEIFDKCWELKKTRQDIFIFNQFEEFGNHLWHYEITGHAIEEVLRKRMSPDDRLAGFISQTGSAGTLGAGDYLKEVFPGSQIVAGEALQCPTLLLCGYGNHRIEGIGDKHIPWIHNVKNTDMVIAVDDRACMNLLRLFNEPAGWDFLKKQGVKEDVISRLPLLGISSIGNLLCAIKFAKYYELTRHDLVVTVWTDSMDLYGSRLKELREVHGSYSETEAVKDYHHYLMGMSTDHMLELSYYDKRRIHNLKYFTWIEQQGKNLSELEAQWYDAPGYWGRIHGQVQKIDDLIDQFNERTGLLG
ncbi:MAG: pyridoxal-5-phosphate-dependent protein subunit beta [Deltaproteobacteria bacterium RBG_16_49_23]|nr:MAG: pyridoxal-5-phosphate-dependent protein subunit beta [Deltaproteobacteria bacterium RBG_16_49_23]